ncbi:MAG: hypothetical protein AAGF11_46260 [Myxococcota bacterium]
MSRCLPIAMGIAIPIAISIAMGIGGGCRPYDPQEPIEQTAQACCTRADPKLRHFEGCRVTRGQCRMRKGETFWMRGRVTCGPVDEQRCAGGRCCSYRPVYDLPGAQAQTDSSTGPGTSH